MKELKQLLIIPGNKDKTAHGAEVDPADVNQEDIAIDWDLADQLRQYTTLPIDTNDPAILARRADFLRRHGLFPDNRPHEPKTEEARQYLEKFRPTPPGSSEPYQVDELELKRLIAAECEEKAQAHGRAFEWDRRSRFMVSNLMLYFANDPRCVWDVRKGLFLHGNVGVGKTMLFEIFRDVSRKFLRPGRKNFKMTTCRAVSKDFHASGDEGMSKYTKGNWCFDELGYEELEAKSYGNSVIPIEEVLLSRYTHFAAGRYFTHLISNITPDEVRDRYGVRLYDRIFQMTQAVELPGESRRK